MTKRGHSITFYFSRVLPNICSRYPKCFCNRVTILFKKKKKNINSAEEECRRANTAFISVIVYNIVPAPVIYHGLDDVDQHANYAARHQSLRFFARGPRQQGFVVAVLVVRVESAGFVRGLRREDFQLRQNQKQTDETQYDIEG